MLEIAWATRGMLANKHLSAPEICWLLSHKKSCWISKLEALESTDLVLESNFSRKFRVCLTLFETSHVSMNIFYCRHISSLSLEISWITSDGLLVETLRHQEKTVLPIQCGIYCNFSLSIDIPLLKWGCREVSLQRPWIICLLVVGNRSILGSWRHNQMCWC